MGNDGGGGVGGAFQPYLDSLRQELQQRDPTLLSVVVALLAVLLTLGKGAAMLMEGAGRGVRAWTGRMPGGEGTWGASIEGDSPLRTHCPPARSRGSNAELKGNPRDPGRDVLVPGERIALLRPLLSLRVCYPLMLRLLPRLTGPLPV